jgi:histidine triad (HIT) family protein
MVDCIFCKIASKREPASVVYEDKKIIAFMDIRPVNVGHALVISKKHYKDLLEMPEKEVAYLFSKVKKIAVKIKKMTGADGISIIQSNGKAALQDVFHIHVHIIPRFGKDKTRAAFVSLMKPLLKKPKRAELDDVAGQIKKSI